MQVIRPDLSQTRENKNPIFVGGPVKTLPLITDQMAELLRFQVVSFSPGARTKLHTHTHDQVLYVLSGEGVLATETQENVVTPGTMVFVPKGEKHWHGATKSSAFAHISITTPGETRF